VRASFNYCRPAPCPIDTSFLRPQDVIFFDFFIFWSPPARVPFKDQTLVAVSSRVFFPNRVLFLRMAVPRHDVGGGTSPSFSSDCSVGPGLILVSSIWMNSECLHRQVFLRNRIRIGSAIDIFNPVEHTLSSPPDSAAPIPPTVWFRYSGCSFLDTFQKTQVLSWIALAFGV